jgi:lipopolysaccharide cholinephosphotransferase
VSAHTPFTLSPQLLRRLQLAELSIVREVIGVCDRNELRYFVIGGTLLGAVRHGGFIPWDDDIDIALPRPDFERLRAHAADAFPFGLVWQSRETEPTFPFLFAKVLNAETVLEEEETRHLDVRHAVSIDVFPLDGTPASRLGRFAHSWFLKAVRLRLATRLHHTGPKRVAAALLRVVPQSLVDSLYRASWERFPYERSEVVVNAGGAWGYRREAVPRRWFGSGRGVAFEDVEVSAPDGFEKYLGHIYGDYLILPPLDQRHTTHRIVRLEVSDVG